MPSWLDAIQENENTVRLEGLIEDLFDNAART